MGYYEDDPQRAEAKAQGVAMVLQGTHSIREAAQSVGLSPSALQRAVVRLEEGTALDPELKKADQGVMAKTYRLADQAQERTLNRLPFMDDRDTIQAMKTSLNAIANYRRWMKPEPEADDHHASNRILDRLDAVVRSGGEVTLSVSAGRTINVSPVVGSDDPL